MNRTKTYNNNKAVELLKEFKELSKVVATQTDEIKKIEEERNKVAIKGQKIKDKLNVIVKNLTKEDEGQFEIVTKVEATDKGEVEVTFTDALEDWKEAYLKRKAEQK